ncbi:MAG TPA: hypothetical protein VGW38_12280 [Chloroflexota bacterium]|nr:hypothetical protein [Chloroflexota bacterium]
MAASAFKNVRRDLVQRHLETLVIMGEMRVGEDGRFQAIASSTVTA